MTDIPAGDTLTRVRTTEQTSRPTAHERSVAIAFVEQIESATGSPQLSDHLRLDLSRAPDATVEGPLVAFILEHTEPVAFAQVSSANASALLEVVVDPGLPDATDVRDDLVRSIVSAHRRTSDEPIVWWLDDPSARDLEIAGQFGLGVWRELYEMRRALPHPEHATVATRDFRPGFDDEAWIAVNNRAFAGHGEQGGWTTDTLALRKAEPWFDPSGFRIHESDGEVIAFCWTKLHNELEPIVGEIYVIAVDPSAHGRGLGKQLTLAGLDSIADRGVTIANLYVDAANAPAVGLYERLGFSIHRRRVALAPPEVMT